MFVCVFVGLLPRLPEIACIGPHQTGSVGEGNDLDMVAWAGGSASGLYKRECWNICWQCDLTGFARAL